MNININWIAEFITEDPDDFQDDMLLEGPLDWAKKKLGMGKKDEEDEVDKAEGGEGGEAEGGEVEGSEVEGDEVEGGEDSEGGEGGEGGEDSKVEGGEKLSPPVKRAANIISDTPGLEAALKSINSPDKLKQLVVAIMMSKQLAHLDKKTVFKGLKNTISDFGEVMREIEKTPEGGEAEVEAEGGEAEGGEAENV